ncbi:MAG: serine/threonine-protein kinase, partial [Phycisphaerales bacterium]
MGPRETVTHLSPCATWPETLPVLLAYHTGELPESSADEVIAHISSCRECQESLKTFDEAEDTLIVLLRAPVIEDCYANEPERAALLARVRAIEAMEQGANPKSDKGESEPIALGQLGEYELLEKLGEGGMGVVYKARQVKLKRIVALKVLPKGRMDQRTIARFEREMEAVGAVDHPNIVRAMDAREIDGTPVLVMEYVAGMNLNALVDQAGPLHVADACELVRQVALGLQGVHENGLIHRDIKPSNLVLTPQGQVKILDLGLALLEAGQPSDELTGSGQAMGTADYIAPEQVTDSHNVDIRADIYSLGCTFYKLLTGQPPFSGPEYKGSFDKLMAHTQKSPPPIGTLRHEVSQQ